MRLKMHILWAVLAAIAIAFYLKYERIYLFGLVIGAMLPDIIEPPTSAWHRRFFHSKRMLKFILIIIVLSFLASMLINTDFYWAFFILFGYELHLLGDLMFHGLPR